MRSSRGEIKIYDVLKAGGFDFQEEYVFKDLVSTSGYYLRFDFAIFDDNGDIDFLIEYQGEQHYTAKPKFGGATGLRKQQYNDAKKVEYCKTHGYKLVIIPYWCENKINYDYIMHLAYDD